MEINAVIGLILVLIVGFFAYQWWGATSRRTAASAAAAKLTPTAAPSTASPAAVDPAILGAARPAPPKEEKMPVVAGQTEGELRAKEPVQQAVPASQQQPVDHEGQMGPADFDGHMRHPEQSFHQPSAQAPTMQGDVAAGRAAAVSTPMGAPPISGHQMPFSPEYATNGGAVVGNSVFAYDGMEPTGFAAF